MGSHQELLAERGLYWKLYQLQYKEQEIRDQRTEIRPQASVITS
jgi:ATP-binding cassette subfamily B protein